MASSLRSGVASVLRKAPEDVVLVTATRLPVAKFKGSYKDTHAEELLAEVLIATREKLEQQGLDVKGGKVEDIAVGTVLMELGGAKSGRLASLHAGFPIETCFRTVNRQCSSSLQTITDIAASIQTRAIDIGIAAGAESSVSFPFQMATCT
ncbi:hypothetical protein IEQ34_025522 [Dendrobium chrysotoxum]|uniref:Thiolase N-terminal domain-containing protein n=1 Tax=Dendrobium chrysotoxum TaxID=161865 RepID=A0AAV7FP95_DENCH|nr:hypothetical protein IEQ34_025522 [Dendrobium chrysotoxum]